jgi:serine/threonine protein kinase
VSAKRFGDRWEVVRSLDEGGQGIVYEVRDANAGAESQRFVLKKLKNRERLERFQREIEAHKHLRHDGIAPLIDFSLADPAYIVLPLYDGPTLEQIAPVKNPLRALEYFGDLCDAVAYAHREKVVHRDLKPANIVLNNGKVVVLDFGLCYFEDEGARLTETFEQAGARFYMAPEIEGGRAEKVTPAVDSYALGKLLYFLLTGRHVAREAIDGDDDLVAIAGDRQLKYVADRIIRKTVVIDAEKRKSAEALRDDARTIHRLISQNFYPGREGALCRFCGEGYYEKGQNMNWRVRFPTRAENDMTFRTLVCPSCRHIEWFGE